MVVELAAVFLVFKVSEDVLAEKRVLEGTFLIVLAVYYLLHY